MSYSNILEDILAYTGKSISTDAEKAKYKRNINKNAFELYRDYDLVGSLREQFFLVDPDEDQITLPWYIWQVRGVRFKDGRYKIDQLDMRPRYQSNAWEPTMFTEWRKLHRVPLAKTPVSDGPFTISIPIVESEDIIIYITGATATSSRFVETLTIVAGTLSVTSSTTFVAGNNNFGIESISKNRTTTQDLIIKDVTGVEIAVLPNSNSHTTYYLYAISSMFGEGNHECEVFEVLYKTAFVPFFNDTDEYPCDAYDDAIVEKYLHWWFLHIQPDTEKSILHNQKMIDIVLKNERDSNIGIRMKTDFGRNRFIEAQANSYNYPRDTYYSNYPFNRT